MVSVIVLNGVMLSVVMLNVGAPAHMALVSTELRIKTKGVDSAMAFSITTPSIIIKNTTLGINNE
jgi:hypothetical protein